MSKNVTISTLPNVTQNYLPKINTSSIFANSLVYDNGTNVMVNTAATHASYTSANLIVNNTGNAYLEVRGNGGQSTLVLTTSTSTTGTYPTVEIFNSGNFGIVAYRPGTVSSNYLMYYDLGSSTNRALSFQTEGVDRLKIQGAGRILMGPTLPTDDGSTALQVNGGGKFSSTVYINTTADGSSYLQQTQAGINATSLTTTTIKNLGIKLGFTGVTNSQGYIFGGIAMGGSGEEYSGIAAYDDGASAATGLKFYTGTNAGVSDRLTISSTGAATFSSSVTSQYGIFTGNTPAYPTSGQGIIDGNSGNLRLFAYGDINFYTSSTQNVVIKNGGNVGIGTTSPNNLLDIGTPITNALYGFSMSYGGTAVGVYQVNNATGELKFGGAAAGYFPTFYAGGSERMRITSGGDVFIGATSGSFDTGSGMRIERSGQSTIRLVGQSSGGEWSMGSSGMQFDARVGYIRFITGANSGSAIERMRITDGGNVLLGSSTDYAGLLQVNGQLSVIKSSGYGYLWYSNNTANNQYLFHQIPSANVFLIGTGKNGTSNQPALALGTVDSERMRITNDGYTKISNDGTYYGSTGLYHEIRMSRADWSPIITNSNATPLGVLIKYTAASPNSTGAEFLFCEDSGATQRASIRSNGGLANYSANNVNLASDIRLKKDISPLSSEWNKLKQIEVVNFKYKDSTDSTSLYGAIAQQVQEIYPELVIVTREATETEPEYYGIREQPFQWITTKVLQEAMAKIEEQQAQIEQLKALVNK